MSDFYYVYAPAYYLSSGDVMTPDYYYDCPEHVEVHLFEGSPWDFIAVQKRTMWERWEGDNE